MGRYAENTSVPVGQSKGEIEGIVTRYGAEGFQNASDFVTGRAMVAFIIAGRHIRLTLNMPKREEVNKTPTGRARKSSSLEEAYNQACRQRWRALCLIVKAKFEAVESGITTIEEEFLPFIVMPGTGRTLGQEIIPQIQAAYETGETPTLMIGMEKE